MIMKKTCGFIALVALGACSQAISEGGYGPTGKGLIGSAYGYSDERLSNDTFRVEYTGGTGLATEARENAKRRAVELCVENGFVRADYDPSLDAFGDRVVASGVARCLTASDDVTQLSASDRLQQRIDEIDTEIASYRARNEQSQAMDGLDAMIFTNPVLRGLSAMTSQVARSDTDNRINALEQERDNLMAEMRAASRAEMEALRASMPASTAPASGPALASMEPEGSCGFAVAEVTEDVRRQSHAEASKSLGFSSPYQTIDEIEAEFDRSGGGTCDQIGQQFDAIMVSQRAAMEASDRLVGGSPIGLRCDPAGAASTEAACTAVALMYTAQTVSALCHRVCN